MDGFFSAAETRADNERAVKKRTAAATENFLRFKILFDFLKLVTFFILNTNRLWLQVIISVYEKNDRLERAMLCQPGTGDTGI